MQREEGGKMGIWLFSWHEKHGTSTHGHDILKNSLDLIPFPALDRVVFFPGGGEEMERDTVMIGTVMDAK